MIERKVLTSAQKLTGASPEEIAKVASTVLCQDEVALGEFTVKDISSNSGARMYLCFQASTPLCIIKAEGGEIYVSEHAR